MSVTPKYFATRFAPDLRRERVWAHLVPYFARYIPPDARVLEFGAGYCYFINRVRARLRVAVDVADEVLQYAAPDVKAVKADVLEASSVHGG
jgi:hypothetical protein